VISPTSARTMPKVMSYAAASLVLGEGPSVLDCWRAMRVHGFQSRASLNLSPIGRSLLDSSHLGLTSGADVAHIG
jgi:hypothetical protein